MVEADFASAYNGPDADLRNLWLPGSGMTFRRAYSLLTQLPPYARVWEALQAEQEAALIPTADRIRERQRYYDEKAKEAG